jgi:hypothetical protein
MFFLKPAWLLPGLVLPLIVLLYFKKKQVLEYRVSCLEFWEEAIREKAGLRVKKIDRYLPLAMQLLTGALLVLAAAGPVWVRGFAGEKVTLALDCSISMRALEDGVTRFSAAREEAKRIIQSLPANSVVSVVLLKDGAEEWVRDAAPQRALEALGQAACTSEPLDASSSRYLDAYPSPVIVVSDKDLGWGDRAVRVGKDLDNAGIVRASYDYYTGSVLYTVKNYARGGNKVTVSLRSGNREIDAATVQVPAGEESSGAFKAPDAAGMLAVWIEEEDMLAEDNLYLVAAGDSGKKKVLLRAESFFLEKALASAADISLAVAGAAGEELEEYDVVITRDGSEISGLPPATGVWLLLTGEAAAEGEGGVKRAVLEPVSGPLTEGLQLKNVYLRQAGRLEEKEGFRAVLIAGGVPVMAYGFESGRKTVCSAIDFDATSLVLLPDFPVLVNNTVSWLDSGRAGSFDANPPPALMTGEESRSLAGRPAGARSLFTEFGNILFAAALLLLVAEWEVYRREL